MTTNVMIAIGCIALIVAYGVVLLIISNRDSKFAKGNAENFYVGGRGVSFIPMLGTLLMSLMSVLVIIGYPAGMYRNGIGYYSGIVGVMMAAGLYLPICYRLWLLGKKYHYVTPTDFFYHRFRSKPFALLLSILYVICIIPYISVQVKGVADYLSTATSGLFGYWVVVFVFLIYIGFHTINGGNKSVTNTDAFAGYCAIGTLIIMVLVYMNKYIGSTSMGEVVDTILNSENANALQKSAAYDSPIEVFGFGLATGGCLLSWPHFMQRAFMAKSGKVMRFSSMGIAIGYVVIMGCCVLFGSFIGPYAFPGLDSVSAEKLMSMLAVNAAPAMACVLGLAAFAFGLSTADSFVVTATSLIQHNIVPTNNPIPSVHVILWGLIPNIIVFVVVSLLTKPDKQAADEIVIPLHEHFAPTSRRAGFKVTMVLMLGILVLSYIICPYIPSDSFVGWMPTLHIAQQSCGILWAVFAFLYYKYRICAPDGVELNEGELRIPERDITSRQ